MTATARTTRSTIAVVVFAVLMWGTVFGTDDAFPFGPFRMYANRTKPSGVVAIPAIEGRNANGRLVTLHSDEFGMRAAELEGQFARFKKHPKLLRHVAAAYNNIHPKRSPLVSIRIYKRVLDLRNQHVVHRYARTVARWSQG